MPEGDSLRAVAARLAPLVGERVRASAPHPRGGVLAVAPRIDGLRVETVEALGKNLLIGFEGGLVLRSHLRMKGRWRTGPDALRGGLPWLVLTSEQFQAALYHGPQLELLSPAQVRRLRHELGPDVLDAQPDVQAMLARLRRLEAATPVAVALLEQRALAGIGNLWRSEILHACRIDPLTPLSLLDDGRMLELLTVAAGMMSQPRREPRVYGRSGRPCPTCAEPIQSRRLGIQARTVYWCPRCQAPARPSGQAGEARPSP